MSGLCSSLSASTLALSFTLGIQEVDEMWPGIAIVVAHWSEILLLIGLLSLPEHQEKYWG